VAPRWIEIGRPITPGMVVYEGDPPVRLRPVATVGQDGVAVSELTMSLHAGTHIDTARHLSAAGPGAESVTLDDLCGTGFVLNARDAVDAVTAGAIARVPDDAERLLVATRSAELWDSGGFGRDLVGLSEEAARTIAARGTRLVGIDYMSIAPVDDPLPVHRVLLDAGVVILEGLDLRPLRQGWHEIIVAPLRIVGGDAAPARVVARPIEGRTRP